MHVCLSLTVLCTADYSQMDLNGCLVVKNFFEVE